MRYLIVGQSSADTAHRLGQTLEASSRLGTAPEDLALWLSRMEKELGEQESQQDGQEPSVTASDREKVWDTGLVNPSPFPPSLSAGGVWSGWDVVGHGTVLGDWDVLVVRAPDQLPRCVHTLPG